MKLINSNDTAVSILFKQMDIHRRNLISVCRLCVKTLIDKSCFDTIYDDSDEFINFAAVLEQILNYRLKSHMTWYGVEESKVFWEYIRLACKTVPNNCLSSVDSMENAKSNRAKGRAWIRMALMEKRLAEYIKFALADLKLTRSLYESGAVMLSDDVNILTDTLIGLNAIDFSFCLKSEDLELSIYNMIDYTPYLMFQPSGDGERSDVLEFEMLQHSDISPSASQDQILEPRLVSDNDSDWEVKYTVLEKKYRTVCEQKGYLEELLRKRDSDIRQLSYSRDKLESDIKNLIHLHDRERGQLEGIVVELQQALTQSQRRQFHGSHQQQRRWGGEMVLMSNITHTTTTAPHMQPQYTRDEDVTVVDVGEEGLSCTTVSCDDSFINEFSCTATSDSQSMIPLAGSLMSSKLQDTSYDNVTAAVIAQDSSDDLVISALIGQPIQDMEKPKSADSSCSLYVSALSSTLVTDDDDTTSAELIGSPEPPLEQSEKSSTNSLEMINSPEPPSDQSQTSSSHSLEMIGSSEIHIDKSEQSSTQSAEMIGSLGVPSSQSEKIPTEDLEIFDATNALAELPETLTSKSYNTINSAKRVTEQLEKSSVVVIGEESGVSQSESCHSMDVVNQLESSYNEVDLEAEIGAASQDQ